MKADCKVNFLFPSTSEAKKFLEYHDNYLNDALYHFMVYTLAIKDSQKPKTIEARFFTREYNVISLKTFRIFYPHLSKQQSKLYYKLGVKCFIKGFYVGDPDPNGIFSDMLAIVGGKFGTNRTVGTKITAGDFSSEFNLIYGNTFYKYERLVQITNPEWIWDDEIKNETISLLESQEYEEG
jgi:hypothetical protein